MDYKLQELNQLPTRQLDGVGRLRAKGSNRYPQSPDNRKLMRKKHKDSFCSQMIESITDEKTRQSGRQLNLSIFAVLFLYMKLSIFIIYSIHSRTHYLQLFYIYICTLITLSLYRVVIKSYNMHV